MGGPGREVALSFGSTVVGLNYNSYQIERAKRHTKKAELEHLCSYVKVKKASASQLRTASQLRMAAMTKPWKFVSRNIYFK